MMKERGLLFTPENYGKTERGEKTQTRRMNGLDYVNTSPDAFELVAQHDGRFHFTRKGTGVGGVCRCPYGIPGDRLYVKESIYIDHFNYAVGPLPKTKPKLEDGMLVYRRDGTCCEQFAECTCATEGKPKWCSPLFMPKWAARLWLEITEVRVERLQDITEEDAKAEGAKIPPLVYPDRPHEAYSYVENYELIWESINGEGSWKRNDWVWVLEYKKVQP